MIIVTGSGVASDETIREALRMSLEHVHRSRAEPGCISHAVHVDAEDPLRLFFFERRQDKAAPAAHFKVPASGQFVRDLQKLLREPAGPPLARPTHRGGRPRRRRDRCGRG